MAEQQNNREEQELNHLLKVRREKLSELCEGGRDPFQITKYDVTAHSMEVKENYEEMEGKEVSLAGRMMSKRVMGKASFCNLQDLQGNIQSYVARDDIGEEAYKDFKKLDIGDISVSAEWCSRLRQVKFPSMQKVLSCSPRAFRSFRRSSTA